MQERAGWPSIRSVQAPQTPCSQRKWVAVSVSRSRKKSARCVRPSTVSESVRPLTVSWTGLITALSAHRRVRRQPLADAASSGR